MAKNLFYVFGEIRIEDGDSAGFLFVGFGQCDALGDAAAHWIGGVKHCYGTRANSEAKSLAASASEMGMTCLAIARLYTVNLAFDSTDGVPRTTELSGF